VATHVRPFKTEEATRARRSSEYGRVMHAGLLTSLHLESHYTSIRNPDSLRYKRALIDGDGTIFIHSGERMLSQNRKVQHTYDAAPYRRG
jgi:hypothetical protein